MSLLDELNIEPEEFQWRDLALCQNMDIDGPDGDTFFDRYESDSEAAKAQDEMCLHCPVMSQCFFAGSEGQHGVWGGVYWNGAGKPDRNRNSHKTVEVWDKIRVRISSGD